MRASASVIAVLVLALACKQDEPTPPPKKVERGVDMQKIPAPEHTPEMLSDPGTPRRVAVPGSLDATVGGTQRHFTFMPKGVNAAVFAKEKDVKWVRVTGQANAESGPTIRIQLDGLRLDRAELPATFKTADKGKVELTLRYEIDPVTWWEAKTGKEGESSAEVTLDAYEGARLRGTFKGTLEPNNPTREPIEVADGSFDVELRLNGVEEGKAADGPS